MVNFLVTLFKECPRPQTSSSVSHATVNYNIYVLVQAYHKFTFPIKFQELNQDPNHSEEINICRLLINFKNVIVKKYNCT